MRKLKYVFILFIGMACQDRDSMSITEYVKDAKPGDQLIDVRTPREYQAGHLPGAENMDILQEGVISQFQTLDKEKTVYVYCQKGVRSAKASKVLDSLGFK
ncbi:MAG: rhodanese-like domain-containing protein, partial [Flavobacteriaceae bacterium]|nr:rhodanese-like domain-containing protein [Flavobacteriaceae bacterium]